jgi:serine/threonine protein phosphatase PrpC
MRLAVASAVVTGARHLRASRNGQDAAAVACDGDRAVAVVCDGCSGGISSEVGARLGARWLVRAIQARLALGGSPADPVLWETVRAALADELRRLAGGDDLDLAMLRECFLFTVVAVAATTASAAVWALGDGAYAVDGATRVLGPFAENQPPYLAYDLIGYAREARL